MGFTLKYNTNISQIIINYQYRYSEKSLLLDVAK